MRKWCVACVTNVRRVGLGLWGWVYFFGIKVARNVRFHPHPLWHMKRSLSLALPGSDYELRNNKVQRKHYFDAKEFATLASHDVLNIIFGFIRRLNAWDMWKDGRVLLMQSKFDDGELFIRDFVYNKEYANTCFLHWHGFLKEVVNLKQSCGMKHLTIQSCTYWSKSREGIHSWESFHRSNFMIQEDWSSDNEDGERQDREELAMLNNVLRK